jgi:secreted trypsin-like serine protease
MTYLKMFFVALALMVSATASLAQNMQFRAGTGERILNGDEIDGIVRKAEWTMSLRLDGRHICGASFISPKIQNGKIIGWSSEASEPKWAITAAHCLFDPITGAAFKTSRLSVYGGALDIQNGPSNGEGDIQEVRALFVPDGTFGTPPYDPLTLENDIALLRLSDAGSLDESKRGSIRLPSIADVNWVYDPYTAVHTAGWGRTSEGGIASGKLLEVRIPMVDHETCAEKYAPFGDEISSGMICAGYRSGEFDSCQGDSGGPLYYRPTPLTQLSAEAILIGIVSWGRGCGGADLFGVYTRIVHYQDWMAAVIEAN